MLQPFVDHNHETGEVRGLVDSECNFAIGFVETSARAKLAEQYLGRVPSMAGNPA